jgi:hypothetical protein
MGKYCRVTKFDTGFNRNYRLLGGTHFWWLFLISCDIIDMRGGGKNE